MDRYLFILLVVWAFISLPANASTSCFQTQLGTQQCTVSVDLNQFTESAFQMQEQSQWCWAASIAMVFAYNGHYVDQARIVSEAYGTSLANLPAYGSTMSAQLNRDWIDNSGREFRSRVNGLYDFQAGVFGLNNAGIVTSMERGQPLIIGALGHAVVLTSVTYFPTPFGPNIVAGEAFDPWPGRGYRSLSVPELTTVENGGGLLYAATVDVSSGGSNGIVAGPTPGAQSPISSGGAGAMGLSWLLILAALAVIRVGRDIGRLSTLSLR